MSDLERRLSNIHESPLPEGGAARIEEAMRRVARPWYQARLSLAQVGVLLVVAIGVTWIVRPNETGDAPPSVHASVLTPIRFETTTTDRVDIRRWIPKETRP